MFPENDLMLQIVDQRFFNCRFSQTAFDPLPKRKQHQSRSSDSKSQSKCSSKLPEGKQESGFEPLGKENGLKGKGGLTPLPAQKGRKSKAVKTQNPTSSTPESDEAFAAQLGKLMQELAVGELEIILLFFRSFQRTQHKQ